MKTRVLVLLSMLLVSMGMYSQQLTSASYTVGSAVYWTQTYEYTSSSDYAIHRIWIDQRVENFTVHVTSNFDAPLNRKNDLGLYTDYFQQVNLLDTIIYTNTGTNSSYYDIFNVITGDIICSTFNSLGCGDDDATYKKQFQLLDESTVKLYYTAYGGGVQNKLFTVATDISGNTKTVTYSTDGEPNQIFTYNYGTTSSNAPAYASSSSTLNYYCKNYKLFVSLDDDSESALTVYNMNGVPLLKEIYYTSKLIVDMASYPAGYYIVKVEQSGFTSTAKFLLN